MFDKCLVDKCEGCVGPACIMPGHVAVCSRHLLQWDRDPRTRELAYETNSHESRGLFALARAHASMPELDEQRWLSVYTHCREQVEAVTAKLRIHRDRWLSNETYRDRVQLNPDSDIDDE